MSSATDRDYVIAERARRRRIAVSPSTTDRCCGPSLRHSVAARRRRKGARVRAELETGAGDTRRTPQALLAEPTPGPGVIGRSGPTPPPAPYHSRD